MGHPDLLESNDSGNAAKLLKGKGQKSESESFDSPPWLAKPASETADKLRAAVQIAATRPARRKADLELNGLVLPGLAGTYRYCRQGARHAGDYRAASRIGKAPRAPRGRRR